MSQKYFGIFHTTLGVGSDYEAKTCGQAAQSISFTAAIDVHTSVLSSSRLTWIGYRAARQLSI
jgi:hypothetical protein